MYLFSGWGVVVVQMIPVPTTLLACKIMPVMRSAKRVMEVCFFVETKGSALRPVDVKRRIAVFPERAGIAGVSPLSALAMNVLLQKTMECAQQMSAQNSVIFVR